MTRFCFISMMLIGLFLGFSGSFAGETKSDDIVGIWLIELDEQPAERIEIFKRDGLYCGKIVWIKPDDSHEGPAVDFKNKNDELKDRPLLGLEIITGYEFDGEHTWCDGDFYIHRKGKTASPKFSLVDKDHLKIQVKILFIKKSFVWQRVAP